MSRLPLIGTVLSIVGKKQKPTGGAGLDLPIASWPDTSYTNETLRQYEIAYRDGRFDDCWHLIGKLARDPALFD